MLGDHRTSTDLAELASTFVDTEDHRAELAGSAKEVLKLPEHPMESGMKIGIGCYLIALGAVALAVLPWAWSLATSTISSSAAGKAGTIQAHFLGLGFTPTTEFSLVIIVILMAIIGSVAVLILTFSSRAGHETLERGYLWWYLTRPIAAAGVGVLFYMTVIAGYFNQAAAHGRAALVVAAAIGGLAGLFTDQVLQKMRGVLGQKPFEESAAGTDDQKSSSG